ncbi:MAG: hypothetical protein H7245_20655, partial [Candidatus Saccharibacteria bacterium]|nr:hypothetical protein [Pseudorhodobacter sp.]
DKPTLLLHIGTHKTGTKTLQSLMANNRAILAQQGFCYARTDRPSQRLEPHHGAFARALTLGKAAMEVERERLVEEVASSGCTTMVLSSESLCDPRKRKSGALSLLSILMDDFDISTICICRRQDYFIESLWNQQTKLMRTKSHIDRFITESLSIDRMTYLDMLDGFAEFGPVKVIGFEASLQDGIIKIFGKATGMVLPEEAESRNVSPSMTEAAIMAALNRLDILPKRRQNRTLACYDGRRRALQSRHRSELMVEFSEQNVALA